MKKNKGFTMIEVMVSSVVFLIVMSAMYLLIIRTQTFHLTEGRKLDMNQASRAIELILCDNIRSAGSVLSLLYTPSFLGGSSPFTGIYPLNNTNGPDGIILASGDPKACTKTTATFDPQGDITLSVESLEDKDTGITAWKKNDIGIIVRTTGYYIFKVNPPVGAGSGLLSIRATPVYYSGLLNTASAFSALQYDDLSEDANHLGMAGNDNTTPYQIGSPVIRLEYFNIFLVKEEVDKFGTTVRSLTLTTDTEGVGDILNSPTTNSRLIPIVPFIEDIQFEYITKDNPPNLWASLRTEIKTTNQKGLTNFLDPCPVPGAAYCVPFIDQFTNTNIASVCVYALFKTEEEKNKMSKSGLTYHKPRMGDVPAFTVPIGRFHYSYMQYEIFVRNYNGVY